MNVSQETTQDHKKPFTHVLPGEHIYEGVLFFGYSPKDTLDQVKTFETRPDDVFIVTYPKAGTTWMQEIVWLIMNDADIEAAKRTPVYLRSPFLEFKDMVLNEVGLDLASSMTSPRVIKSHLPVHLMPEQLFSKKCKTVLFFRNPKDVCVSYFHFYRSSSSFGDFKGTWRDFLSMFVAGHVDHGSWFDFTRCWWSHSGDPQVKLVFYEDLQKDPVSGIRGLANFLGQGHLDDVTLASIASHCSFDQMRANPMTNHLDVYSINDKVSPLLRKGTVGDWKNHFTVLQSEQFDEFMAKQLPEAKNIPFTFSL